MKSLKDFIFEKNDKEKDKSIIDTGDIKFTIWKSPDERILNLNDLKDNEHYQKIEYKFEDKDKKISIDFLIGFKEDSWQLWIGKIGSCSYDDDPYYSFKTDSIRKAIIDSLDKIPEFINKVKEDPNNYIQFYKSA